MIWINEITHRLYFGMYKNHFLAVHKQAFLSLKILSAFSYPPPPLSIPENVVEETFQFNYYVQINKTQDGAN